MSSPSNVHRATTHAIASSADGARVCCAVFQPWLDGSHVFLARPFGVSRVQMVSAPLTLGVGHDGHLQSVATQRRDADYLAVRFSNNRSQHGTAMYPGKETSAVQPREFATVPCALVQFDQTQTHIRKHSLPFDSNKSMWVTGKARWHGHHVSES